MDSYKITQYKKYSHIVILTDESFNYILKIPQEEKDLKNLLNEYELYQLIDHPAFDSYNTYIEYNNINIDSEIVINKSDKIYNLKLRNLIDINNYDLLDNKFSVLIGDYDTNMITFFEIKNNHISMDLLCQIYIKIFSIIKFCNDTYNFVHCDFKSNNILVDKNDPSNKVKIIDLEFSFIINENTRIKDLKNKNVNLYLQLKKNVILTPKFLKFLDIYALCVDFIYYNTDKLAPFMSVLDDICNKYIEDDCNVLISKNNITTDTNNLIVDDSYVDQKSINYTSAKILDISNSYLPNHPNYYLIDFYIILTKLSYQPKDTFYDSEENCLNMSFNSILKNISISLKSTNPVIQKRIEHINNIINEIIIINKK